MGYGTGVLQTYWAYYFIRGLSVGIAGIATLFVARRTGVQQGLLVASRGVGLCLGPNLAAGVLGRVVDRGETQLGMALALMCKAMCAFFIPRSESHLALYGIFFALGIFMSALDTLALVLVTRFIKKGGPAVLSLYDACYGLGGMVAPFIAVALPEAGWEILAIADTTVAMYLVMRRLTKGKPRQWQAKLLAAGGPTTTLASKGAECAGTLPGAGVVPPRILRAGVTFTYASQVASTSVTAWGFTFASCGLGLPDGIAAMVPATFCLAATLARTVVAPLSLRVLPSAMLQGSALLVLAGASVFQACAARIPSTPSALEVHVLLSALALMGAGCCPHYSFVPVAMAQHGELRTRDHAAYSTAVNVGVMSGLVLPGLVALPTIEVLAAAALAAIMGARARDFPWRQQAKRGA